MSIYDDSPTARPYVPPISRLGPIIVGASFAAIALARQSKLAAWFRGFISVPRRRARIDFLPHALDSDTDPAELRDSILGRHKAVLMARYGSPRSAAQDGVVVHAPHPADPSVWRAQGWYYVLDEQAKSAMSIRFDHNLASEVEFFDAP